jgi:tetratricopeptide (TPR) repeat protein
MRQLLARRLGRAAAGAASANPLATSDYAAATFLDGLTGAAQRQYYEYYEPVTSADGKSASYQLRSAYAPYQAGYPALAQYVGASAAAPVEGVYLEGHGVIFTVTLPAPAGDPKPSETKPAAAAVTEWERIQKELRGEKPAAAPAAAGTPPSVGDILLKALADNGKNFRHLPDAERLTVVVTFRGRTAAGRQAQGLFNRTQTATAAPAQNQPAAGPGYPASANQPRSARDYELLGDLHLRQQQNPQAIEAFQRALQQLEADAKATPETGGPGQAIQQYNSLASKMAQALLAAGKVDEARAMLEKRQQLGRDVDAKPARPAADAKPAGVRLPGKLVVSAPKRLLDAVGSGKMPFDEFRKAASVEVLTFGDEAEAKPGE